MRMSCYEQIRQVNARALGVDANNATTPQGESYFEQINTQLKCINLSNFSRTRHTHALT